MREGLKMVNRVEAPSGLEDNAVPLDEGMPDINPEKVCFIIVKAREWAAAEVNLEPDGSNDTDDQFASVMTKAGSASTEAELRGFIDSLDDDEQIALTALMWIGRGDYDSKDWKYAVSEAGSRRTGATVPYLLGTPLLSDYLETALAEFGESCADFEFGRL
jgi:hypothetical protein